MRVRLIGELGNQLFEWATGYALSRDLGLRLELQAGESDFRLGEFLLDPFDLKEVHSWWGSSSVDALRTASGRDIPFSLTKLKRGIRYARHSTGVGKTVLSSFVEPEIFQSLRPGYCQLDPKTVTRKVLRGYFQAWAYFDTYDGEVRNQLRLKSQSDRFEELNRELVPDSSLAIHVRLGASGKALLNPGSSQPISERYIRDAYAHMSGSETVANTVIFTDNADNVAPYLSAAGIRDYFLVDDELLPSAAETLVLLSRFRHIIGSASTFSLWAGFLQEGSERKFSVPKLWIDGTLTQDGPFFKPGWTVI